MIFTLRREDYITIWGVHQGNLGTTPETKKANRPHGPIGLLGSAGDGYYCANAVHVGHKSELDRMVLAHRSNVDLHRRLKKSP